MTAISEQVLAAAVVAWLQADGWQVWQEVAFGNSAADIVAMQDRRIWIIECKARFGLDVIAQAHDWRGWCHWISVAYPAGRSTRGRQLGLAMCRGLGLGALEARGLDLCQSHHRIIEVERPAVISRHALKWRPMTPSDTAKRIASTREKLSAYPPAYLPAGTASGGRWTPFKASCAAVAEYVEKHPGCTCSEMIRELGKLHYSTPSAARGSIAHWALARTVPGVDARREGGATRLYPTTKEVAR